MFGRSNNEKNNQPDAKDENVREESRLENNLSSIQPIGNEAAAGMPPLPPNVGNNAVNNMINSGQMGDPVSGMKKNSATANKKFFDLTVSNKSLYDLIDKIAEKNAQAEEDEEVDSDDGENDLADRKSSGPMLENDPDAKLSRPKIDLTISNDSLFDFIDKIAEKNSRPEGKKEDAPEAVKEEIKKDEAAKDIVKKPEIEEPERIEEYDDYALEEDMRPSVSAKNNVKNRRNKTKKKKGIKARKLGKDEINNLQEVEQDYWKGPAIERLKKFQANDKNAEQKKPFTRRKWRRSKTGISRRKSWKKSKALPSYAKF